MIKTYASFLFPGLFMDEVQELEVSRDVFDNPEKLLEIWPKGALGALLFEQDGVPPQSGRRWKPGHVYLDAEVFDAAGIRALDGTHDRLLDKMRWNNWPRVVRTCRGNWKPLEEADVFLMSGETR